MSLRAEGGGDCGKYRKATLHCGSPFFERWPECVMHRVGQNRIYTPYMTVYLVISLPRLLYIHPIYMVLANPGCAPGRMVFAKLSLLVSATHMFSS